MSKATTATILGLLLMMTSAAQAQTDSLAVGRPVRVERPNLVTVELMGRGVLYSVNYERYLTSWFGLGVGAMGFGNSDGGLGMFPVFVSFNPVGDEHSLYLSAGATFLVGDTRFFSAISTVFGNAQAGYQMQLRGGFVLRATANFLFSEHGWLIWPGVNLGGSF
ncbi:MAG: hypothetical protein H6707_07440 [Deltaproteobacteria bacterium]|nr:hypothetical protein [Deltaproteobacteria bacterium]